LLIYVGWATSLALVLVGWGFDIPGLRALGIWVCAVAGVLSIIRDNQHTRRMLNRAQAAAQKRDI
jgi:hypothetical protein